MDVRKIGKVFGWLFIATFVTSIPARLLFVSGLGADWQNMRFIPGALSENRMYLGAILEFGVILANVATAIVLYPVVRRRFEAGAIGYVAARIIESAFILVGLVSLISVVSVSQQLAGASGATAAALTAQGGSLVSTYEWAFLFGPGLVVGFGNGLLLGYLMYRSGLVPRRMAMIGMIGGPMLILSFVFTLFGVYENGSGPSFLLALPEIVWEASLGIYAAWKGFRSSPSEGMVDVREAALEPRMAVV
jgi:Domain of unknown function (DUF4386)